MPVASSTGHDWGIGGCLVRISTGREVQRSMQHVEICLEVRWLMMFPFRKLNVTFRFVWRYAGYNLVFGRVFGRKISVRNFKNGIQFEEILQILLEDVSIAGKVHTGSQDFHGFLETSAGGGSKFVVGPQGLKLVPLQIKATCDPLALLKSSGDQFETLLQSYFVLGIRKTP